MMRLDKYLSERLGIPRGESRKLAAKGRVTVNGVLTKKADTQIEEATAEVAMDGRLLAGAYQKYVYLMLNKPEGVVSAAQDKRDTTVVDLVKDAFPRRQLFPAGRLDKTSTGFVLLTDDGTLAHDILAPGRHVQAVPCYAGYPADQRDAGRLCRRGHIGRRPDAGPCRGEARRS